MNVAFAQGDWGKPQDFFVTIAENKIPDVPPKKYMLVTHTVVFQFSWIRLTGLILFRINHWKKMTEQS